MKLDSARDLKARLIAGVVAPFAETLASTGTFALAARTVGRVDDVQRSVALGVAPRGNQFRLAIRVQRPGLISSPLVDRLVREARGEADVRMVGRIDKRADPWFVRRQRPLLIGASCGHVEVTAGSIGAFCERAGKIFILSNNHVLANENFASKGDRILQPGRSNGGGQPDDRVARLREWVRLKKSNPNMLDCAIAEIDAAVAFDPIRLRSLVNGKDRKLRGLGPDVVDAGDVVYKVGRTTGATKGRVTAFDVDNIVVNYEVGNYRFDNQIEIEGSGRKPFSDGGDSGSIVMNARMEAVAMLFAGSEIGGKNNQGLTYANPIHDVLDTFKATLLV